MKIKLTACILLFAFIFNSSCADEDLSELSEFIKLWVGPVVLADNPAVKSNLSLDISSTGNPVTGTYVLGSGANAVQGNISGSALGLIYTLTLKPKTAGITYTVNGNWDGKDAFTGTMKGVENSKTVTYNMDLRRQ